MNPDAVRSFIAAHILPQATDATLGQITLLPHQCDAVARITRIMSDHRGALLADEVGMGKTYVALGVARQYSTVHIIAPAALVPMWRTACARADLTRAQVHSLHGWSGSKPPTLTARGATLVIIDEAHHLRNPNTRRYRHVADALSDCDVLLLSATPIHNRPQDLHALISLFRSNRGDNLSPLILSSVIVRRRHASSHGAPVTVAPPRAIPAVRRHAPLPVPQDRETLTRILALPAPLPAHDGAVAGALIRLGLLRAWCSSDAQLTLALTRRRLRGEALHDALREGRHPTHDELRAWVVGEDAGQLAFPELLASHTTESGPLLEVLQKHLNAIGELTRHHQRTATGDAQRVAHLRTLLDRHPNTPVVAFSQYTHTIQSVFRALSDIAGVGAISGSRARIASGALPREELLALFAPGAAGRPPPPSHLRVRLLLTTDLLAEGVNLQDAGVVVHLDLPWTHALHTQRVGRVARIGSPHTCVHVYHLAPPPHVARALRAERRLAIKRKMGVQLVGADSPARQAHGQSHGQTHGGTPGQPHGQTRPPAPNRSAADWRSAVLRHAQHWSTHPTSLGSPNPTPHIALVPMARGPRVLALALIVWHDPAGNTAELLVIQRRKRAPNRWSVSRHPKHVWHAMRLLDGGTHHTAPPRDTTNTTLVAELTRIATRWMDRRRIRQLLGPTSNELPAVSQALVQRIAQCHGGWSAMTRARLSALVAAALARAQHTQGAAADAAQHRWLQAFPPASASDVERMAWMSYWQQEPALVTPSFTTESHAQGPRSGTLAALLVGYPAPPPHYPSE